MAKKSSYGRLLFTVVILLLMIIAGIALFFRAIMGTTDEGIVVYLNDCHDEPYDVITVRYLVREEIIHVSEDYKLSETDIGDLLGTVTDSSIQSYINSKAYSFSKLPEDSSVCIVDTPTGYQLCLKR